MSTSPPSSRPTFIKLATIPDLVNNQTFIKKGVAACLRDVPSRMDTVDGFLKTIAEGRWAVFIWGEPSGFALTSIEVGTGGLPYLYVGMLYSTDGKEMDRACDDLLRYASFRGCRWVTMRTSRNTEAFQRRLKKWGFREHLVELIMDVQE